VSTQSPTDHEARSLARQPARARGRALVNEPAFAWIARSGLVARAIVYGVIGVLALEVAIGIGGKTASQRGAMLAIARQPLGKVLLIIVAVGLGGYAVWRFVSAALGRRERDEHKLGHRVAAFGSGVAYAALCVTAIRILVGAPTTGGTNSPKQAAAGVLSWTGGPAIVAAAGVVLIIVGAVQAYRGVTRKFLDESNTAQMRPAVQHGFAVLGVIGHLARTVVFALIGYGLITAALDYSPRSAIGLDGALARLARASYGPLLLGVVAAGFVCFALFSLVEARYRRI
jgi:Domain of Unknown Function (DUF1206)